MLLVATLVGMTATLARGAEQRPDPMPYPLLPEAISSIGATVSGDFLYVFGGHVGRIPGNSLDSLSPHFCRLDLTKPGSVWEDLAMQQSSQSPGLVAWEGKVYRVGGLSFKNRAGDATAFNSLDVFARYNPENNTWTTLPSLPSPRSSLDAAVVDGRLYVVGGWNLQEGSAQEAHWHETALVFDLSKEDGQWKEIARPPFVTRALAAAAHNHKLYVLGGMQKSNEITQDVHIYDPQTDTWSAGPKLKSNDRFGGFAISAFATGGKLCFSGSEGVVYALNEEGTDWQPVERLVFPRSFHRIVPASEDKLLAVAGVARGGGYLANVEVLGGGSTDAKRSKLVQWSVSFDGHARHSQVLALSGASLYAFGGNRSPKPHDFSREAFVDEAFRFDLPGRSVEQLPNLPAPLQSGGAFVAGSRNDQSIYVAGGLAPEGDKFQSSDAIYRYRLRSKAWAEEVQRLPSSRAMLGVVTREGNAWMFGGSQAGSAGRGLISETWFWNPTDEEVVAPVAEAALAVPRRSFGSAVLGERYYAVGGLGDDSQIVEAAAAFDFTTRKWADIASPSRARVFPSLAAAGGRLYLSGGFSRVDGHFQEENLIEVYEPESNAWKLLAEQFPLPATQMTMLEYQDRLLFYGIDKEEEGVAHFALLDLNPGSVSFGVASAPTEERSESADLATRLMRMDRNKDGKLSPDEVGERFRPIISRVDENRDGVATREEIEAFVKREDRSQGGRPRTGGN